MSMRQVSLRKLFNVHFAGVVVIIAFNYFVFTYEYMINFLLGHNQTLMIVDTVIFHLFFILLLWAMIRAIITDPGRVPIYWGFFAEENDNKKRRYCLLCHSFKPERCHHCSTCQRCVLNMDHHCPWISNCVGYTNRKFFMLFLFYIIITLIISIITGGPILVIEFIEIFGSSHSLTFTAHTVIRCLGFGFQFVFFIIITMFFKFHVELVMTNSTTLDNLERQRNPNIGNNVYNLGSYQNFVQVFGTNAIMWPWPLFGSSLPKGDGVIWKKNDSN